MVDRLSSWYPWVFHSWISILLVISSHPIYLYIKKNPCLADCPINASIYGGSPSLPCCHVWVPKGDHNDSLLHIVIVNHCNLLFFINESLMIATYHILVGYSHTGSWFSVFNQYYWSDSYLTVRLHFDYLANSIFMY